MDVVIPLRKGHNDDIELRFALRSFEKYMPELGNVFVIGHCPTWLTNVIHIPATDHQDLQYLSKNIFKKIMIACEDKRVSDSFCVTADDHFLLDTYAPLYHYSDTLIHSVNTYRNTSIYRNTLLNTVRVLPVESKNFNLHYPIVYNKELFERSVGTLNWKVGHGYAINSVYCNMNNVQGFAYSDLKIKKQMESVHILRLINNRLFFSIDERAINKAMISVLQQLYPVKSSYES